MSGATVHESLVFEDVLQPKIAGRDVWADTPYRSEETKAQLKKRKLRQRIQYKANRDTPLTTQQQDANQSHTRIQAHVEHVFAHNVTAMGDKFIRTIGVVRAHAKSGLKNLTYNFQRFVVLEKTARDQAA